LITGACTAGLVASLSTVPAQPQPEPHMIDGLPVTDLAGITVRPPTQMSADKRRQTALKPLTILIDGRDTSFPQATVHLAFPNLRMPYYSFGSTSLQIGKE